MAFNKKTVKDIDLANKTVLVRVDYNVLNDKGEITEDYRISAGLPTLKYLIEQNCKLVLISHAGRPDGKVVPALSLKPIATKLPSLIGGQVQFVDDCIGVKVGQAVGSMGNGQIILLENLRFHPGEEANDPDFAKRLAAIAQVFVQDGFGVVHRAHASTSAITQFLPSVAGLLLEKEVDTITDAMENPKRPFVAIIGGAKVSDKIDFLERLVEKADHLLIGGAMANTFLKYLGYPIGKSIYESGQDTKVKRILDLIDQKSGGDGHFDSVDELHEVLTLPYEDVAVGKALNEHERRLVVDIREVTADEYILDLGPQSVERFAAEIHKAATVIWNGPLGMTEFDNFAEGSSWIADSIAKSTAKSIIGGGDTAAFLMNWSDEAEKLFDWISTGGGASLELMAGKKLPGVEALLDK